MEQSKLVQNIIVRARNEALAMRAQNPQTEHIYLAILKVSTLTSEKIAPSSPERAAMDEEITELNRILEKEQISADSTGILLRGWLKTKPFLKKQEAEDEVLSLFARAGEKAKEKLKAADLLRAILTEPKELIRLANEGRKPDLPEVAPTPADDDLFDAETAPGELPNGFSPKPQGPSTPSKDQERGELYAMPGANSQSGGGSERSGSDPNGASSHSNTDAKKRMVLPSFDPNEFSGPALTIHNLGDGDGSISGSFDSEPKAKPKESEKPRASADQPKPVEDKPVPEEKKPASDAGSSPKDEGIDLGAIMADLRKRRISGEAPKEEEEEPAAPQKHEPEKPAAEEAKPKREGVDLGAIMEELRQKRLRGESGEQPEEPAKTPEPAQPKPAGEPEKKSGEGIDLSAIMQELRERRIRGEQSGDAPSKPEPENKPDGKPQPPEKTTPPITLKQPVNTHEVKPAVSSGKKRTTDFLGRTYKGGTLSAVLKYLLRIVLYFVVLIGAGALIAALSSITSEQATYLIWYLGAMIILAVYYLLRAIPGLIELKFPPFAQSLKSLLAVAAVWCITELLFEAVYVPNGWVIAAKILMGLTGLIVLSSGFGKIRMLPNTRGVKIDMKFCLGTLTGSPDKVFYEALLISCMGPLIVGTVFWILMRPLNKAAAIYLFACVWYLLILLTSSQSRWNPGLNPKMTRKEEKRKKRNEFFFMQIIMLTVPAFLLFLSILYHWFPVPLWAILVYAVFGVVYLLGTLSTLYEKKT